MCRVALPCLLVILARLVVAPTALAQPPGEALPDASGATADGAVADADASESAASEAVRPSESELDATPESRTDAAAIEVAPPPSARLGDPRARARVEAAPETSVAEPVDGEPTPRVEAPPLVASAEVSIGMAPTLGYGLSAAGALGALAGLGGLGLGGRTDFVFAVDPRVFLGLGLSVSHSEYFGTSPSTLNQVEVPLIAQVYLDTPRRGAAVPTLRVVPAFHWDSQEGVTGVEPREAAGGRLTLGVGVTWFAADWLALRLLGDVGASAIVAYRGPEGNAVSVFVAADVGVVVRL